MKNNHNEGDEDAAFDEKPKGQQTNEEGPVGKILWDIAAEKVKEKEESLTDDLQEEKNVLFVGSHDSGKSTIILRYTDRNNEVAKPTIALDYTFCRKAKSGSSVLKHIGHIWELGEGTFLLKLIDVVVNPENILNTSVIITLDLSKLNELWFTMENVITYLKRRIKECVKEASKENPKVKERIIQSIRDRMAANQDESKLDPLAIPTAIVCTKYDLFEAYEPEEKKIISKTLRFIAHYFGAALIVIVILNISKIRTRQLMNLSILVTTCSLIYKNETTVSRLKNLLNSFLLDGTLSSNKQTQIDHLKPIYVPFGSDSMESIGLPPLSATELNDPNHKTLLDLWRTLFCKYFPQEESKKDPSLLEDYGRDPQFEEPVIDSLKEQKMKELDSLREILNKRRAQSTQSIKVQIIS